MTKNQEKVRKLVLLGLLTAVLLVMSNTPLGSLKLGLIEITLNVIPVGIAAISLGVAGGAVMGAVFGLTSFLQCIGVGIPSAFGATLFGINPVHTFVMCFAPRVLAGIFAGLVHKGLSKLERPKLSCFVTGFCVAFFNTLLFMSALVLLFGNTEYISGLIGGRNIIVFVCTFVGVNAVYEMIGSTVVTGAVGTALKRARLIK